MPTPTYDLLAEYTVTGTTTNSVTFNSLDQSYKDLIVTYSGKCQNVSDQLTYQFNATASIYKSIQIENDGTANIRNNTYPISDQIYCSYNYSESKEAAPANSQLQVFNYALNGQKKPFLNNTSARYGNTTMLGQIMTTSPLTSCRVFYSGNFAPGAKIAIYGVIG